MGGILFRNAHILDGSGATPFAGDVLVEGNRVVEVRPGGRNAVPVDAQTVECEGATLMPGLIEPHAHLSFVDQATPQALVGSSRVDLQACKLEYSIVSPK